MTQTTIRVQMAQREDTAANWTSANPILLSGEIGYENDTTKLKIGDGTTNWNSLAYHRFEPVTSWTLTANGTTDYIFSGTGFAGTETDPDLYVVRGQTYKFINAMGAHPFQIQSTQGAGGTAYNDGITNNGVSDGTLTWEVRMDAPSTLYYQCTSHADMNGTIYVLDEGSAVASIDNLSDVDTSTVAPTDGQALVWDNANSQWEPGTISGGGGTTLPSANDGEALIYENGQWIAGPVIGGVNYATAGGTTYTVPTGFTLWSDTFTIEPASQSSTVILTNGDRTAEQTGGSVERSAVSTSTKSTGKWYWEIVTDVVGVDSVVGITQNPANGFPGDSNTGGIGFYYAGSIFNNSGATVSSGSTFATGDTLMLALDADAKKLWFGKNGTWHNSGDPAAGTGAVATNWTGTPDWYFACRFKGTGGEKYTLVYGTSTVILASASIRTLLGIDEYATDSAAGTGGLSSGELYYNTTSSSYVLKT